ncbi:MAG: aminoglycoside phosphotransferase family protein [Caldilineaceae bacterium]
MQKDYGLAVANLEFLPIGHDASAGVYRVSTKTEAHYFLKVTKRTAYPPSLLIPHYLKTQGIPQVIAPLPAKDGALWQSIDGFTLLLYPFIDGQTGKARGLTDGQWIEFGALLRQIHAASLSATLLEQIKKETFVPRWGSVVKAILAQLQTQMFQGAAEQELAEFWQAKQTQISGLVARAEELGRLLQQRTLPFVLCHADIHIANLLLDQANQMFVVDWDEVIFAPKERDLMFVVGTPIGKLGVTENAEALFLQGYDWPEVDPIALAYYRYEWVVQDIGELGKQVFVTQDHGEETKQNAVRGFRSMFEPGSVVDAAYRAEGNLPTGVRHSAYH